MAGEKIVICELLAYVNTYRKTSAAYNVKQAVLQHYNVDKITEARNTMVEHVKDIIPQFPSLGAKRTDSVNRTAKEIMVFDIIDMYKALDKTSGVTVPVFVAADVRDLPPACPEVAADIMSVHETLASQQRQLAELLNTVTQVRKDVEKNKQDIKKNSQVMPDETNAETGQDAQTQNDRCPPTDEPVNQDPPRASGSKAGYRDAVQKKPNKQNTAAGEAVVASDGEGFQAPGRRPNKGINKSQGANQGTLRTPQHRSKVSGACGTAANDGLCAGPKQFQMQITNVGCEVTEQQIADYIATAGSGTVVAEKVEDMSSPDWDTKRFIVTFKTAHRDAVNAPDFWPKDIYYKRWFKAKAKKD